MKNLLPFSILLCCIQGWGQLQTCPVNINYSETNLTHWFGYTGVFLKNTTRIHSDQINYDSTTSLPTGTVNTVAIPEYGATPAGILVNTVNSLDPFGNFDIIPTINGYPYNYSMRIGSTTINSATTLNTNIGGLFRGLGYTIKVPPGLPTDPYVVTYAYAMVLESAPHVNEQVPQFTATLITSNGTISCADAAYHLPTIPGAQNGQYVLDQAAAIQEGFSLSPVPSPNQNGNPNENPYRVWTKGWTEVIFDLAPYRGQQVTLTFEADNCVPTGHFAYAYVALKDICQGLQIEGTANACSNGNLTYSIPELAGATYQWTIPSGWQFVKDSANTITVTPDTTAGLILARATNSCADLKANITVNVSPPTIPGAVSGDTTVCAGLIPIQGFPLALTGNSGSVLKWVSSTDGGINWTDVTDTSNQLSVKSISATTLYRAIVQNGPACLIDSSNAAKITLNLKPIAGLISPNNIQICLDQPMQNTLTLNGTFGNVSNWQSSTDQINWANTTPVNTDTVFHVFGINGLTYFRAIVANTGCPPDTSNKAQVGIYNVHFPNIDILPKDTTICFGTAAYINATINYGTSYHWMNPGSIYNGGNGIVSGVPFLINARTAPSKNTDYIISISNAGCPNILYDTIHVNVTAPLSVFAGNDTSILINQPLQLNAVLSDQRFANYLWIPPTGLNNTVIASPIAILDGSQDYIRYSVTATDSIGCSATNSLLVTVLKNGAQIFVPTGFTPNADGRNDVLRPTVYGITQQYFFSVYNRWGQQIFFTTQIGKGWDGTLNGVPQPSGAYVFIAEGADYLGHRITRKGTSVLIR